MVVFYFYTAGVTSVATQYHRGVYVFITYVLVFLLYPASSRLRAPLAAFMGLVLAGGFAGFVVYPDVATFHARLMEIGSAYSADGLGAALGRAAGLWPLWLATLALAAGLFVLDRFTEKRWPTNPSALDALLALLSAAVVYYWIAEFESLNYRAGAETEPTRWSASSASWSRSRSAAACWAGR